MARFNFTSGRAHGCVGSLEYQMRGGVCVVRAKRAKVRKARMIVSNTDPYPFYEGDLAGRLVLLQSGLLYQETQTGFMADKRIVPELYHKFYPREHELFEAVDEEYDKRLKTLLENTKEN